MNVWILTPAGEDAFYIEQGETDGLDYMHLLPGLQVIMVDEVQVELACGQPTRYRYRGEEVEKPDYFWSTVANTDSFLLERVLLADGVKSVNKLSEVAVARSKTLTYQRLAAAGVPMARTLAFFRGTPKSSLTEAFDFPFVVKADGGFGGTSVRLIEDDDALDAFMDSMEAGCAYNAQEYIAASKGRDLRVVLVEGEVAGCVQRRAANADEFRSNVHLGGSMDSVEISPEVEAFAKKVAGLFDLPFIGLDFLYAGDTADAGLVVAEVNAFPGTLVGQDLLRAAKSIFGKLPEA